MTAIHEAATRATGPRAGHPESNGRMHGGHVRAGNGNGISPLTVLILARKEIRDALRNRWFLLYAVCFAALSLTLASVALAGTGRLGIAGYGRTAASLVNLVLLIVPLMGLTLGAGALSGERERGTLEMLLAQPVVRSEVLLGKFVGLAGALFGALAAGFGVTGAILASRGAAAHAGQFMTIVALSVLLAWAMLSVGLLISSMAGRTTLALGCAVFAWLGFVFLGDLGLMGGALTLRLTAGELLAGALVNPLQVFKIFAVSGMHGSLDLLGPAGLYAAQVFGPWLPWLLCSLLLGWIVLPLAAAAIPFSLRGVR